MTRKNYTSYKDGLPVVNLSIPQLKAMMDRNICIKIRVKDNGSKQMIRIRKKPLKKLTLQKQNYQLRAQLKKMASLLKQGAKPTAKQLETIIAH